MAVNKSTSRKKKNEYTEPEEASLNEVNQEGAFDPINSEELVDNAHKNPKVVGDTSVLNEEMPYASHEAQTINLDEQPFETQGQAQPQGQSTWYGTAPEPEEQFNPEFSSMPEEEQNQNAELTADALIHAYSSLKLAIPSAISISEKKLNKLHDKGEININQPVRANRHSPETISVKEFVNRFNDTLQKPFETKSEFKESVKPLLVSILKKKGFAPTPEQLIIYYVGMDLAGTAKEAYSAKVQRDELIDGLKSMHDTTKVAPIVPQQPVPNAQTTSQASYQEETKKEEAKIVDAVIKNDERKSKPGRPRKNNK
jgi:hypothetical protein